MWWRLLKLFPQCFGAVRSEGDLTQSQWLWLQCQLLLDDGVQACPTCETLSLGLYCRDCGTRLQPEQETCEQCHMVGVGMYCIQCGAQLRNPVAEAIDADTFDWEAWAQSLTPFLGGLTPQEQALLAQG